MLKTFIHQRPATIFDPNNKSHRELYYKFLSTSSWVGCPYQWVIEDDSTDVVYYISKKITTYYLSQEFSKPVAKKQQKISNTKVVTLKSRKNTTK